MATSIGRQAEKIAKQFLKNQGLKFIESNFYSRMGEIDLIMQESDTLIFIEVRYRKNTAHGSPLETITPSKQNKIRITAESYLGKHKLNNVDCRFDTVGLSGNIASPAVDWIKNAF
ncbi:MAG TPA: YraN family protein [Gammaproteobacteria bacterium]|jgi:putative endonuclease|nr:YraN family protein [Pseudomonadota bacterium]HAY46214.1 YraN family protein [Gammaproteobacteria bacterium]